MEKSLYERLGGYNSIAGVVDDFKGLCIEDKQLGRFFILKLKKENETIDGGYAVGSYRGTLI